MPAAGVVAGGAEVVVFCGAEVVVVCGAEVVVVGGGVVKALLIVPAQVTVLPPPLAELLHCVIFTGSAIAVPETVHFTRIVAPPPFPELLHWVTVALVVLPVGRHATVGAVPPPVPDPRHWLTVTPAVVVPAGTTSLTVTLHVTLLPPP